MRRFRHNLHFNVTQAVVETSKKRKNPRTVLGDGTFKFTELPAEIRNKIYFELLVSNRKIIIKRFQNGGTKRTRKQSSNMPERSMKVKGYIESDRGFRTPGRAYLSRFHTLSILVATKSIHNEARQIFYGANTFIFMSALALSEFKARTDENFALLRDLKIVDVARGSIQQIRNAVSAIKSPEMVELSLYSAPSTKDLSEIAECMWRDLAKHFVSHRMAWIDYDNDSGNEGSAEPDDQGDPRYAVEGDLEKGFYTLSEIVDLKKQRQRFKKLRFGFTPGQSFWNEDMHCYCRVSDWGYGHTRIKAAVLACWESELRKQLGKKRTRASSEDESEGETTMAQAKAPKTMK